MQFSWTYSIALYKNFVKVFRHKPKMVDVWTIFQAL